METIFLIGTGLAFFFEFLLLQKRRKSISDIILSVWMFVIGLHLFSAYGLARDLHHYWTPLAMIFAPFPMLHGPFLYLYVQSLIREERKFRRYDFLHFLPYFLGLLPFLPYAGLSGEALDAQFETMARGDLPLLFTLMGIGLQFSGLLYALVTYFSLEGHRKRIKDRFSFAEEVSLNWVRYNIIALGLIYVVVILSVQLEESFGVFSANDREIAIFSAVTLFVFFFGYFGIRQESIFTDGKEKEDFKTEDPLESPRYSRSGLKAEQLSNHYRQLQEYMETEKPYLESRLTLNQLAEYVQLSPNHLSQVINEKADQNFYQFVNTYRIQNFQQKLQDPKFQNLTLLALALDCGFNSKSSFNHIFKKMTGMTPSQYQQSLKKV
jgi:AraC-like DNA-binding protein